MTFTDSHAKIERANQHIAELELWLSKLPNSYVSSIEINATAGHKSIKHDVSDTKFMTTAALLVGDIAHNLKCALDYAWIETTRRALPEILDEYTRFPIRSTRDELESTLKGRKIDVIHPRLFGLVLDEIKPYDRDGNFAIWPIYVLDRQDKHRLLIPLVQYSNIRDIQLQDHTGNLVRGETWATTTAPPYRVDFRFDVDIKHEGELTLSIAIDETLIQYAPSIKGLFSIYSRFIVEIVESLERFVKTA